jgi:hypothetical protein
MHDMGDFVASVVTPAGVHLVVLHCLLMENTDTKTTPQQKRTAAKRKEPRPQPHTSLRAKHCGGLTYFSSTYFRTLQP